MRTYIYIVFSLFTFLGCTNFASEKTLQPLEAQTLIGEEGETVILGFLNRANLNTPEFQAWLEPEYENLKIPKGWVNEHISLTKGLTFKIILGTWCGDTQRELGGMFKLLDLLGVSEDRIEMYSISEAKDSPLGYEEKYDILNIPTLIFMENGKENNRIVEFPVESLVEDFSKILKKQAYKDSYSDF